MTLRHEIEQEIRERGPMPFSRYMELCLYHPELGYYSRNVEQFGKAGDFYTSSDVHAVFGRLLARQFEEMWWVLGSPQQIEILELGPGRGLFAQDVLDWSEKKFPEFFRAIHYTLAERSQALRGRLQTTLDRHFKSGKASFPRHPNSRFADNSLGGEETAPFNAAPATLGQTGKGTTSVVPTGTSMDRALAPEVPAIVFANEFFDALPVEVVTEQGELRLAEKDGTFIESCYPASVEELEFLDRYSVRPEGGERIEANLIAQRYMSDIASVAHRGFVVAVDYGYTQQEQLAGRHRGTVTAYRQHSISATPYEAPGEQDITAHVNFTALAVAVEQAGMQVQPLLTQSQFLLGIGEQNQLSVRTADCR